MSIDILVISSNYSSRIAYAAALSGYGYEVAEAQNFADAYTLLEAAVLPNTIIIDLKLSTTQAETFIAAVRESFGDSLHIIVIGGNENEEEIVNRAGSSAFLYRPVDLGQLFDHVVSGMRFAA